MFSINRNHQLFDIFFCQKKTYFTHLFENISCKTSCFLITRNHRLLIFGQKRSVITIGEKYFMHNLLFFNRPRSSIVCCSFCVKKKHPSFTTFERYFTSCKSVNDHLLFVFFLSRHFTFYSDRLKVLSNLKNEKIFADIDCEV